MCKVVLHLHSFPSIIFETSEKILQAQSTFFGALLEATSPDDKGTKVLTFDVHAAGAGAVMSVVAMPASASIPAVLSYPGVNGEFCEKNACFLSEMWKLMHQWGLDILIQRFKRELHEQLFSSKAIRMHEIMKMETMIAPQNEARFFESCYLAGLVRDVYSIRGDSEGWQKKETPIWCEETKNRLRSVITQYPCRPSDSRGNYCTSHFSPFEHLRSQPISVKSFGALVEELE